MPTRVYLDTCALNRLSDQQTQVRIQEEAEAVTQILDLAAAGLVNWIASDFVELELAKNPDTLKRGDSLDLLELASELVKPTPFTYQRALALRMEGYDEFDALHLAMAEESGTTHLLTVDDRFLRRASLRGPKAAPIVENPVNWMRGRQPWLIKH